jgi:hypothetical protein
MCRIRLWWRNLIGWCDQKIAGDAILWHACDPLLLARGAGRHLSGNEHADEQVRRLRETWALTGDVGMRRCSGLGHLSLDSGPPAAVS